MTKKGFNIFGKFSKGNSENYKSFNEDIWIPRFIVFAVFFLLGMVYVFNYMNPTGDIDIPTDLLAGLTGAVIAYYFKIKR